MKFLKTILFILVFLSAKSVFSQDFEISPASLHYKLNPFETEKKIINITNHSNSTTFFKISYSDYIFNIDGKIETVQAKSTTNSCIDWLVPDKDIFELKPNETYKLKMSMQVPTEDYMAHWGYIYVQTTKEVSSFDVDKQTAQTGVNLLGRIAIEVVRTAKIQEEPEMSIKELRELNDSELETKNTKTAKTFTVLIDNQGSDIHACTVLFIASNLTTAEEYEFDLIKLKSYPGFLRKVTFTLPNTLPEGEYSFVALLDYGNKATIEGTRLNKSLFIVK